MQEAVGPFPAKGRGCVGAFVATPPLPAPCQYTQTTPHWRERVCAGVGVGVVGCGGVWRGGGGVGGWGKGGGLAESSRCQVVPNPYQPESLLML